jgi:hypothetical protein
MISWFVTALTVVHDVEVVPRLAGLSIDKGMPNGSVRTSPTAGYTNIPSKPSASFKHITSATIVPSWDRRWISRKPNREVDGCTNDHVRKRSGTRQE